MTAPDVAAAWERLNRKLRHHAVCYHAGLALWNRDEETCDCGLTADVALIAQALAEAEGRRGRCTNTGASLPDRQGVSYVCTGHASWCTACLRWQYEPLQAELADARRALADREDAETVARRLHDACPTQSLFIRPWDEMYERERGYWLTMARALETPHTQPKETQ